MLAERTRLTPTTSTPLDNGPRGAVGGCSTPGSRVDPWWNPGPLFPSTPGPPRIDEGPPDNVNGSFQFCLPATSRNSPSEQIHQHHHHHHQQQSQHQQQHHHQQQQQQQQQQQNRINARNSCTNYGLASVSSGSVRPSSGLGHTQETSVARGPDAVGSNASIAYGIASSSPEASSSISSRNGGSNDNGNCSSSSSSSNSNSNSNSNNLVLSALLAPTSVTESADRLSPGHAISSIASIGSIASTTTADSLNGVVLSSLNARIKTEESSRIRSEEQRRAGSGTLSSASATLSSFSSSSFNASLLSSLLSTSRISSGPCRGDTSEDEQFLSRTCIKLEEVQQSRDQSQDQDRDQELVRGIKVEYTLARSSQEALEGTEEEDLATTSPYDIVTGNAAGRIVSKQSRISSGSCPDVASPTSDIGIEMKYETQTGPPTAPPHLTSSGVEPPHSSQGSGIVVGGSPAEVVGVGVDSLLLSPWGATGPDFLEPPDVKQTAAGLQDTWDTLLLGSSVGVASAQSLAELKPLPPFTGYTGHLSINGIPGHHYHTIASSAQRPSLPSSSPTPSSNQEYYESPVVSSSTPCPQANQKQQQQQPPHHPQHQQHHQHQHQHQQQQQQQQPQHHQHQHQHQQQQQQQQQPPPQQQQLPQSTQQVDYDIEDIAEIIGSAIADTTVPGGGNGPGSEHDPDASRDWIDIAEWIDTACSPKAQETTSPSPYSQIYATATPSTQTQQHGSTLQSLLTHGYAPLLQARLQAGNAGLQNASCGETPSSTSPYPPVSPPGRVSTSCSPDHLLHSSFAAPSHPRKRSRPGPGSQNPSKKNPASGATALPYGTESGLIGGKEKPVHRCSICNRGFLNKSNIKVHLRTHTGEKPFRCEVCGKAFRQKAHLIKHQQIHKRIGRD